MGWTIGTGSAFSIVGAAAAVLLSAPGSAQENVPDDSEPTVAVGEWAVFPFVSYTPETGFGGGVVAGYYRPFGDAETSAFLASAQATLRGYFSAEWVPEVYLPGGSRVDGEIRVTRFPDVFFGVGRDTPREGEEEYTSRTFVVGARGQREVRPGLRLGPKFTARYEDVASVEEGGTLEAGTVRGAEGGTTVGLGAVLTRDGRDNIFSPRRGGIPGGGLDDPRRARGKRLRFPPSHP